jgi:hypothetical protein
MAMGRVPLQMRLRLAQCEEVQRPTNATTSVPVVHLKPFASVEGSWKQDMHDSDSLMPFVEGLGIPGFAAFFLDRIQVRIQPPAPCDLPVTKRHLNTNTPSP